MVRLQFYLLYLFVPLYIMAESSTVKAFEEGALHGQITLFSYDIERDTDEDAYVNAVGGYLKYNTDPSQAFFATVRFHTSQSVGYSHNLEDTALFQANGEGLTANSEAFLAWKGKNTMLKAGNLMLNTPMMNDDTTRIVPWSYQGMAYIGEMIPDTKVQLYHIVQIRSHTSDTYLRESASGEIGSGITMLGLQYDGIKNVDLQSYYYFAPDLYSTFIAQAGYKLVFDDEKLFCLGIQYFKSGNGGKYAQTENKNGGDDIDLVAVRVGYDAEDWLISLNYSQSFGLSGIVRGYGGLAKVFTTSMIANGRGNYKPETWMLKTQYNLPFFTQWGQNELAFTYTHTRTQDSRGDDFDAHYAHWRHRFWRDSSLFVRYEAFDFKNNKSDVNFLRVIVTYDF